MCSVGRYQLFWRNLLLTFSGQMMVTGSSDNKSVPIYQGGHVPEHHSLELANQIKARYIGLLGIPSVCHGHSQIIPLPI
jgi:hypothetical protein